MKKMLMTAALAISVFSSSTFAAEVKTAVMDIEGLFQKDKNGLYDLVFSAVEKASGQMLNAEVMAPNRLFKEFEGGKVSCISPANTNPDFYDFGFETVQSASMTPAKVYIFTAAGTEAISDLSALSGKKVGIRSGMPYGNMVESAGLKLVKAASIEANIKKLAGGRIDAFLGYYPDAYVAFDGMGMEQLPHTVDTPVTTHDDTLLCRKDKDGEAIIAKFNEGFEKIDASGELTQILGE